MQPWPLTELVFYSSWINYSSWIIHSWCIQPDACKDTCVLGLPLMQRMVICGWQCYVPISKSWPAPLCVNSWVKAPSIFYTHSWASWSVTLNPRRFFTRRHYGQPSMGWTLCDAFDVFKCHLNCPGSNHSFQLKAGAAEPLPLLWVRHKRTNCGDKIQHLKRFCTFLFFFWRTSLHQVASLT